MFIYLHNDLKSHPLFGNVNFWEKYTLLAVRNEMRNIKITYKTKIERDALIKDAIFSKLCNIYELLFSFGLPKDIVMNIISSYCDSLKLEKNK